jgi:xanthine dehydrogenase accessory factor
MKIWLQNQLQCEQQQQPYALVTVQQVQGSSPRDVGSKMLITAESQFDSIGGGHLEYQAVSFARTLLGQQQWQMQQVDYPLAAKLGQCCGGHVRLHYEVVMPVKMPVMVFGAGHVGRALVPLLAQLPVSLIWVDGRYDMLPKILPMGVQSVQEDTPVDAIADAPANTCYIIMTHHHGLDLALAEAALKRLDARYVGVIGSATKAARFRHRLRDKGLGSQLDKVFQCPVGIPDITGKLPAEVAIAVAAKIMQLYQQKPNADEQSARECIKEEQIVAR